MHFLSLKKFLIFIIFITQLKLSQSSHQIEIIKTEKLEYNSQKVRLKI